MQRNAAAFRALAVLGVLVIGWIPVVAQTEIKLPKNKYKPS